MVRFKPVFKNITDLQRQTFGHSSCLLTISVGQESHEGERFAATMAAIGEKFQTCVLTLHDSLQRYTIALDKTEPVEAFHPVSVSIGDEWLARNVAAFDQLPVLPQIIRWDDWLMHPNYAAEKKKILALIERDATYKACFDATTTEFLLRYRRRLKNPQAFDEARAQQLCFDYLVEECAVLCLWPETACEFELYTGKHNLAMIETRKHFILPTTPDLIQPVVIGFNKRPDLKPQQFTLEQKEVA